MLFHQGVPVVGSLREAKARQQLASLPLSPAGAHSVAVARRQIDAVNADLEPLKAEIARFSRRQPGCRALQAHYGIGPLFSVAIWAEMGDTRRFSSSADAVRHTGLDVNVWSSDRKRAKGHLSRQGPSVLRWSLYEAAQCAANTASPDHALLRPGPRSAGTPAGHPVGGPQARPLVPAASRRVVEERP